MRVLNCSDAHADWRTSGVDRYDDVAEAFAQTVKVAREEKVDLYLFTGDLCDPDDGPRALRAVALAIEVAHELACAGIQSWWLAGNHDVVESGEGRSTLSPLARMRPVDVKVFDGPRVALLPGKVRGGLRGAGAAIVLPYPPASKPYDPAEVVRNARADRGIAPMLTLVAGHLTRIVGVEEGEEDREMARGRGVAFPLEECDPSWLLIQGHFHHGQAYRSGDYTVHIPGSLVRLNHGEEKVRPRMLLLEV